MAITYEREGDEFRVNTFTTNHQEHPVVAGLSGGGFVVSWASLDQDGSGYGIFAQRYGADGLAAGVEFRVNATTSLDQKQAAIVGLADGGFVVSWMSVQDGSLGGIYAQRHSPMADSS